MRHTGAVRIRQWTLQLYDGLDGAFCHLGTDMQFADTASNTGWFHITSDLSQDCFKSTAAVDAKTNGHWNMRLEYSGEFASHFRCNVGTFMGTFKFCIRPKANAPIATALIDG